MNHIDLVDKYYDLNKDKKLVRFHLSYENLGEALELSFNNTYRFKKEIIEQIDEQLNDIPKDYKCDLKISFKEKIDSKTVVDSFYDELSFINYHNRNNNNRKHLTIAILFLSGLILLLLNLFLNNHTLFTDVVLNESVNWVIDTFACVLIWEGFTLLFLIYYNEEIPAVKIVKRINSLIVINNDKEEIFVNDRKNIHSYSFFDISAACMLTGSVILLVDVFYEVLSFIDLNVFNILYVAVFVFVVMYEMVIALGAFFSYLKSENFFTRIFKFLLIIDLGMNFMGLVTGTGVSWLWFVYDLLFMVSLIIESKKARVKS